VRLRIILVGLSLLAFLSVSVAGYLYYSSLRESAFREAEQENAVAAERVRNDLSSFLSGNLSTVKTMAGTHEVRDVLSRPGGQTLQKANFILDLFRDSLGVDVCYLMDREGNTIASSNRNAADSFVGKNFSFRPYWRKAIQGIPASYMALGVVSNVLGVYSSHPVYSKGETHPIGVAVIKASTALIEEEFRRHAEGTVLLANPEGVVFLSNRQDWIGKSLRKLNAAETSRIARTQQFGAGPWEWTGLTLGEGNTARDESGTRYLLYRKSADPYPGWHVYYLRDFRDIYRKISGPLVKATGSIVLAVCILIGVAVFIFYRTGSDDIVRRREAEEALHAAKEELRRYSRELERKVEERTREVGSILRHTPAVVTIKDGEGRYTYVNSRYEDLFEIRNEEIRGKTDREIFPEDVAARFRENDRRVFEEGRPIQEEETVPGAKGARVYLSTKFPLYDDEGRVAAVCGIALDITEIGKARDQMRRLSDSILASQEKERSAVSRELHDELGQVLTAIRLDATWLRERLRASDPAGLERADATCDLIDKAIEAVRGMATRLRPGVLDDLGLVDALEWYINEFEKRSKVSCVFRHYDVPKIGDRIATAAYRITQEALTNVARHSRASTVDISLRAIGGLLILSVEDDGRGFEAGELGESRGLGVVGMRERAELIGGVLDIRSRYGQGTLVRLRVPLEIPGEVLH
jgi:PAS domain S-box-containing protein